MKTFCYGVIISLVVILMACQPSVSPNGDKPVSSNDTPATTKPPDTGQMEIGQTAMVDSLDALILESWPLQVHAVIKGNLPDGCTTIQRVESRLQNKTFILTIFTQRDKEAFCTQVLVPFEETYPLDVVGLSAGTYKIEAHGITAEFTLDQDNVIESPSGG